MEHVSAALIERNSRNLSEAQQRHINQLAAKYKASLPAAGSGRVSVESLASLDAMMAEWNPIGYPFEATRTLLGPPSSEDDEGTLYTYDTGRGGAAWRFIRTGGRVGGVIRYNGE